MTAVPNSHVWIFNCDPQDKLVKWILIHDVVQALYHFLFILIWLSHQALFKKVVIYVMRVMVKVQLLQLEWDGNY